MAEICNRYHPVDFEMHSFEHVVSNERKACNWDLLEKRFKVRDSLRRPYYDLSALQLCPPARSLPCIGLSPSFPDASNTLYLLHAVHTVVLCKLSATCITSLNLTRQLSSLAPPCQAAEGRAGIRH